MRGKKVLQWMVFSLPLVLIVFLLFNAYTVQNQARIAEQNKNYAEDSMRQKAGQVSSELENGVRVINAYAYFLNDSLDGDSVSAQTLGEIEENSVFDTVRFIDAEGVTYFSDGRTVDSSDRDFYVRGMRGESGISVLFDERLTDEETRLVFYAPVRMNGEIVGIIRGSYVAELCLKEILRTTYFGEPSTTWLCMPDGRIIASSNDQKYSEGHLLDMLQSSNLIDSETAKLAKDIFKNGGEGAFICEENSKTDNLCVSYVPGNEYVMVQLFPPSVTQKMIRGANAAGVRLEIALLILFAVYFIIAIVWAAKRRKKLEVENRQINYVLQGLNTLFSSRYLTVDLDTGVYSYTGGVNLKDNQLVREGNYANVLENHSMEIIGEEAQENFRQTLKVDSVIDNLSEQDTFTYECHVMRDEKEEWEQLIMVCLERNEGKASKILYVRQNITEMKKRELRRKEEMAVMNRKERQYRIAITSSAFSTFELNLTKNLIEQDVTCVRDNEKFSLLENVGLQAPCSATECFDKWKQFILPESMEDYTNILNIDYLKGCFEQGEAEVDVDYWSRTNDMDGRICVRQSFFMTRDDMTNDLIAMVVSKNITDQMIKQKEQTEALQDALMHARQANEAKTTFLSNMSHDIRTPMNAIIGFATIAASRIDNKNQVKECLEKVLSSSNHLLSLINDILDMSRIESGKMQIHEQECNISELMHNLVNIIQPQVKAKQLELFIDTFEVVNEDVITDPLKLNQIFINLMSNAVKYTPAGGMITFRIMQHTTFKHGYGDYVFIIKDNGIGMSEEFVKHVFEPFERETTTTRSGIQGTGLGMTITKNIVEMMNGTVAVESKVGKGSTFTVELTLKLQDVEKDAQQIKELEGLRALVVDDDFNVCDSVSKMLKTIGLRAEWTTSGREAVYRAKVARDEGDSYHTYIIDWQMPETSGIETARKIRSTVGEESPIIILTAYDWSDIEEEAKAAGVTAFCAKPLFMSDLKSALLAANSMDIKDEAAVAWKNIDFSGKRVLLVEDIELNREIAEVILTESGFEVEFAPDGTDAVDMVKRSEEYYYDVVLMDVQMPIMNGYEATRAIRSLPRQDVKTLPIIAMTANALEEDKAAALKSGMNDHIAKPLDIELFIELLSKHLER